MIKTFLACLVAGLLWTGIKAIERTIVRRTKSKVLRALFMERHF